MAVNNFIPSIWSGLILSELEKNLVYGSCVNRDYEKDMVGDTVYINEVGDISISNYTKNSSTLNYDTLDGAAQTFTLDSYKSFSFKLDDVDAAQVSASVLQEATRKAVYAMRDVIDQYIADFYSDAGVTSDLGTDGTPIDITSTNVIEYIIKVQRKLDDENCPENNRFMVVPPWMVEKILLLDAYAFQQVADRSNGTVGKIAGMEIKKSNNVPNTASAKYKILAGSKDAITFAMKIDEVEALRDIDTFSDLVRGLTAWGGKVIQPNALAVLTADEGSEV